jgi:hypothetical protein
VIVWLWDACGSGQGVSDNEKRAMDAAEEYMLSGGGQDARVESARTVLDSRTLIRGYERTGTGWQARRGEHGAITWESLRQAART